MQTSSEIIRPLQYLQINADGEMRAESEEHPGAAPGAGFDWLIFDRMTAEARRWLEEESGLESLIIDALLAEETRPRCTLFKHGALLNLRGVNLNVGMQPDDMISLRLWIGDNRVIAMRRYPIRAIGDVLDELRAGRRSASPYDLVCRLAWYLARRAGESVANLQELIDTVEEDILDGRTSGQQRHIAEIRRQAIVLRRYLAPQRDALTLFAESAPDDRAALRETIDAVTRFVEDLEALRDRATIVQDDLLAHLSEATNRNMFVLAILSAFFLPLGFITGLLGVNVAGMPGTESPWAFWALCGLLALIMVGQLALLHRLGWFRRS